MFIHLRLCLATAIHNIKWMNITQICLIWDQIFTNIDEVILFRNNSGFNRLKMY